MLKVGLTGGIGSGKSMVCGLFEELNAPIIDADVIARRLVEPNQPALALLVDAFGGAILNKDGSLNRTELRQRAFSDAKIKQTLDAIMHPLVYAEIERIVADLRSPYCIIAIPLLVETQKSHTVDRILVVDCPVELQINRVLQRDNISREQAEAIIAFQADRQQRLAVADDVIDNSGSPPQLAEQVKSLHNSYLLLATTRTTSA
ncbi:MAG: dephospho-CoA kinase [Methylomonas sp.]|nr:dephospho-CoA kinase [Methylomonas sp.]